MKFKRFLPAFLAASLVLTSQTAYASTSAELTSTKISDASDIICYWSYTNDVVADLSIRNGIAAPAAIVKATYNSAKISGQLYLQKQVGSRWERVKTWDISGTGSISTQKSYTVIRGETYRCRVVVDVEYNGHSEHVYANSASVTA